MNALYNEIRTTGLGNTAKTLMAAIGEDRIAEIFSAEPADIDLPVSEDGAYRLTLVAPSGYVLWDSHVKDRLVNHIDREEIRAALEGREGYSRRISISTGMNRLYYALPVFKDNTLAGVFRLSYSIQRFEILISSIIFPFLFFALAMVVIAFWAIFAFSRSLSGSLCRLVSITQAGTSLLTHSEDLEEIAPEFRSLERALRAMTEELNVRFEQAKAEGSRLEAILNGMSEAVFAMDASLKLHLVNPKAREIFNLENTGAGVDPMSLLEATRSTELVEIAKKAISCGSSLEKELTFHTGKEQFFQVYASPLNTIGETRGAVLVLQEVTQLVKLERVRRDFVANVSHELRTPIQIIKGFSETLLDTEIKKENEKQIIHFIELICKNAAGMEHLTNNLLTLASLENSDNKAQDREEQAVSLLIEEAVVSVDQQAKNKQIEIIVKCREDLCVKLYGSLIIQALINLIDNSIKYSPPNSKIWVSAFVDNTAENEELIFEVRDKGIGIPCEHLERIFERFYRVDRARSRAGDPHAQTLSARGTGLGLSIVRHIALLHRGKAEAESHAGEGSTFRIKLPLHHQDHPGQFQAAQL
ncbi:MAG: ATP-binding protein [Treponema sp.]|nr:ATP-binding protein [Treponema sp.]